MAAIKVFKIPFVGVLALIVLSMGRGYGQDSTYVKKKVDETEVEALFSYYTQDGDHSAVTGGQGTENLQVYSTHINISRKVNQNRYLVHVGVDVISSASTDKIDYIMSSASRVDQHTMLGAGYGRELKNRKYEIGGQLNFSLESDYFSRGGEVWLYYESPSQVQALTANFQAYFDDLRWGRLKPPYIIKAQKLIYPQELRDTDWFDIYERNSYNFSFSYRHDLNKRMSLTIFPSYTYQQGLLSTPFHRIFLNEGAVERVENLPRKRNQFALGVQLNSFIQSRTILRSFYQFYVDDFGLSSNTLRLELPIKLKPTLVLSPFVRYNYQDGSRYFKPYGKHTTAEEFYTSDYDLSTFWSGNAGLDLRIIRGGSKPHLRLGAWSFRYSFYYRSDGLTAHILSTYFDFSKTKPGANVLTD